LMHKSYIIGFENIDAPMGSTGHTSCPGCWNL
jgi:hypothetical protein